MNNEFEEENHDENNSELDDYDNKIDLSSVPLSILLDECRSRTENFMYAFVDTRINNKGSIVHFDIREKWPGSMSQFVSAMAQSSKECAEDYLIRTLQNGNRYSAVGTSSLEDENEI